MIKGVVVQKIKKNDDKRGWLAEFYRSDEMDYEPAMCYVSVTEPGIVRGPHEHVKQSDCFVFVGPGMFELHLWDRRTESETEGEYMKLSVGELESTMVIVPPGVVHGYKNVSKIPAWCINMPDKLYRGKHKEDEVDEIRWEEDVLAPFKIV